jgi:hypothetical protein
MEVEGQWRWSGKFETVCDTAKHCHHSSAFESNGTLYM